mgnify:CR=1 FL=1
MPRVMNQPIIAAKIRGICLLTMCLMHVLSWSQMIDVNNSMDLITDLPPAGPQFDCVLVITDRYSRYTIAIPTYKSLTGEEAARLFFEHVVLIHGRGLPISIFSDRDPRFISAFFTEFFVLCGVKLSTTCTSG